MVSEISYNLPGHGFAKCYVIGQTNELIEMLDSAGFIEKSKNVCQLGTMKYVYPGAHHTRYEYIFTQLLLISNIAVSEGTRSVELSLKSNLNEYESKGYNVSGSEILQFLAVLTNVGHMYDTFTASRILLRLLIESKNEKSDFYTVYRRNLPSEIQKTFDETLEQCNYYKLHLYNMIHILKGISNTSSKAKICNLGIQILIQYINPNLIKNEATERIFFLYKKIRKIAYLSIDMVYTPASFGANLSRMIYSISNYIDELFVEDSPINQSIFQLESIIHTQIYDSSICVLNSIRIEQERYDLYKSIIREGIDIYNIRRLISEFNAPYNSLHTTSQPVLLKKIIPYSDILLSGFNQKNQNGNILEYDSSIINKMPNSRILFGTQITQNLQKMVSSFALVSDKYLLEDTQTIISQIIAEKLYTEKERPNLVKYAIRSLYKYGDFFFNLTSVEKMALQDCVIISQGCKSTAKYIRDRFSNANISNADKLHEVLSCADCLEQISYSGLVICFVGGIKANKFKQSQKIDEIDGFIYFPNRDTHQTFAIIVEAKNYPHGGNDAEKQLKTTKKFLSDELIASMTKQNKYAFMELKHK